MTDQTPDELTRTEFENLCRAVPPEKREGVLAAIRALAPTELTPLEMVQNMEAPLSRLCRYPSLVIAWGAGAMDPDDDAIQDVGADRARDAETVERLFDQLRLALGQTGNQA